MTAAHKHTACIVFIVILALLTLQATNAATPAAPARTDWALRMIDSTAPPPIDAGKPVVVAVIDTGVDTQHPALRNQIWVNAGESGRDGNGRDRARNGVDDDQNGYIDDVHGWNFVTNSSAIEDQHGHGTHIAGIIAGYDPRTKTLTGVAPQARLMVLKYYDPLGTPEFNVRNTVQAIRYAVRMGAAIVNYSSGGPEPSFQEEMAIREAQLKNVLFVAATGNDGSNLSVRPFFPAGYGLSNILSVTAHDPERRVLASSNFGSSVDLAAPGQSIRSTLPGGAYGFMTGTSQATAFVTGVAALMLARQNRSVSPGILIRHIVGTGMDDPRLADKTRYRVRLNARSALSQAGADQDLAGRFVNEATLESAGDFLF
jgi:subtilisin family serine protease